MFESIESYPERHFEKTCDSPATFDEKLQRGRFLEPGELE